MTERFGPILKRAPNPVDDACGELARGVKLASIPLRTGAGRR